MNDYRIKRRIIFIFVTISIVIPVIVMFWHPGVGGLLLLFGASAAYRAVRFLSHTENEVRTGPRRADTAGKTILVQIVDDYGRYLPPLEVERRIAAARAEAGPRDTVIPVKFKVEKKVATLDRQDVQNS